MADHPYEVQAVNLPLPHPTLEINPRYVIHIDSNLTRVYNGITD
jgi:hypothetical protein